MFYGVDYYPEHWPEDRWEIDAHLMEEAGINVVRLAEFAWAKLEPDEGLYDFSWLDKAISILSRHGIKVVLGTPTAAPPKWLIDKHPEILPVDEDGHVKGFGSRRHYCYNNPVYRQYTKKIVTAMAEHYESNPDVICWHIDNEFGCHDTTVCYCDNCMKEFKEWLKERYGTIDKLNESWGTVFWSQTYKDWDSVIIPRRAVTSHNPSLLLDYKRFSSDSVVKYQKVQIDILREITPDKKITHNFMGLFNQIDYYKLAKDLDFISWDNYPINHFSDSIDQISSSIALSHDVMRGVKKKNFWVMEQQSGPTGWEEMGRQLKPSEMRLWVYQSIAHGADAIVYFRWRACTFGTEEYWHGILDHDGIPRRRYNEVKQVGHELRKIGAMIEGSEVKAEVAIIRSFDNEWAFEIQPHKRGFRYMEQIKKYYKYFYSRNIPVDIISPEDDLSGYKLVLAPGLIMVNEKITDNIKNYVRDGGTFLTTWRAGAKRWDNRMNDQSLLGPLKELLGIDIEEYSVIPDDESIDVVFGDNKGTANTWYDVISPVTAKVLGEYKADYISGKAVITVNKYGRGNAYYVGTIPSDNIIKVLLDKVTGECGISVAGLKSNEGIEVLRRIKGADEFYFVLNFNRKPSTIIVNKQMVDILTGEYLNGEITLEPFEVRVLSNR
ncbi:beta-galactosidase [Caldanaerobius fijiensis DSM 17918]|uniref:Beta-galactosidase n=1 Tax=Caldanaerobius fijiensis DSM 17918 TaxID=1121256 RepID=A0A1M5DA01_9THEO|nr:beta-galactosidase [Caldanaerobius fijiensis]SHF63757.1 beta-galactosidase [Caldanaerobius fijiensis DSM 17918]